MRSNIYHDNSTDLALIRTKKVAVIGYGSQGHAQVLNLKDCGAPVRVGLLAVSESRAKAQAQALTVTSVAEAPSWADVIIVAGRELNLRSRSHRSVCLRCNGRAVIAD